MFRLSVSVFTILGLMASQLAAVPHGHAGMTAQEKATHDAQPHVHVGHSHKHGHRHKHSHDGHKHTPHHKSAKATTSPPKAVHFEIADHDATVIFLQVGTISATPTVEKGAATSPVELIVLPAFVECLADTAVESCARRHWHPPDEVADGSATYLTLCNLRN